MSRRRGLIVPAIILLALLLPTLLAACAKGPETDLHLKRVIISSRWNDPPSFRAIDPQGREYDFFVTDKTEINSGQAEKFTWEDVILGDDLEIWANKIEVNP
jgi:hypothetical protein